MLDSPLAEQLDVPLAEQVLNVLRDGPGGRTVVRAFAPRSLLEHEHATLQVSVLLPGTAAVVGSHTGGGRAASRRLRGSEAYVVPPGQPHDFRLARPRGMVNFLLEPEALEAFHPDGFGRRSGGLDELATLEDDALLPRLAAEVHAELLEPCPVQQLYLEAAWTLLAAHLARRFAKRGQPARPAAACGLPQARLRKVLDYVETHAADGEVRVADLAGIAGYSPVHFTRLFAAATRLSPLQYLIRRRLERARDLLAGTDLPVAAIAQRTGFASHARLTERFRRQLGTTPRDYRAGTRG